MSSEIPLPPGWEVLSHEERVEYIHKLWSQLAPHRELGPGGLTPEQLTEVERRIAWCKQHPDELLSWEELSGRLDARRGARGA